MRTIFEADLHGRVWCNGLFARIVWQQLFNWYRNNNGDLDNMDNMLCDFDILKGSFRDSCDNGFHLEFYFDGGTTDLSPKLPNPMLIIEWDGHHSIKIIAL